MQKVNSGGLKEISSRCPYTNDPNIKNNYNLFHLVC